ncbi:ORFL44W, partial [Human betaherpesvirus 5]
TACPLRTTYRERTDISGFKPTV